MPPDFARSRRSLQIARNAKRLATLMEVLALLDGAQTSDDCLHGRTAWTDGEWDFGGGDHRHWKAVQNIDRDIIKLAQYLIGIVRADVRGRRAERSGKRQANGSASEHRSAR